MNAKTRLLLLALLLLPSGVAAQDRTTLDGEPAIRFLSGHGHLRTYCLGTLWITPTRIRFDSYVEPPHSYNLLRSQVQAFEAGDLFGFHYVKVQGGGDTYRMALAPDVDHSFGDRVQFAVRAFKDFNAATAEVARVEGQRRTDAAMVRAKMTADGPAIEFAALAGHGVVYSLGAKKASEWEPAEAAADAYRLVLGNVAGGTLVVTMKGVQFRSARADDAKVDFESPKEDIRIVSAAGGYPRVVLNVRKIGRITIYLGEFTGDPIINKGKKVGTQKRYYEATPLLRALGPEFPQLAAGLLPKPTLIIASTPPGAEVFVDGQRQGVTLAGGLRLPALTPGKHELRATLAGYQPWSATAELVAGEEKKVEASLVALPPPAPAAPAGPQPFQLADVVAMLQGGVSPKRVAALVQQRGVSFPLDDAAEKQVRAAGGDAELLVVIAKAKK